MSNIHRTALLEKFHDRMEVDQELTRRIVSSRENKQTSKSRWFKYKEGFSAYLVEKYLPAHKGAILDPFAGSGTTLFTAAEDGWAAYGIEIMPVGVAAIRARKAAEKVSPEDIVKVIKDLSYLSFGTHGKYKFPHIKITDKAFSPNTEREISVYMDYVNGLTGPIADIARFAAMSVLEEVSFTRKDGQFLRWDARSGKTKSSFDKGEIPSFREAIKTKLREIFVDIMPISWSTSDDDDTVPGVFDILEGSCLHYVPRMESNKFDMIITSPPYANRYDYTRTYALELAFCGLDDLGVKRLRQKLLSATVENQSKCDELMADFEKIGRLKDFCNAVDIFQTTAATHEISDALTNANLNNPNVVGMVYNYLFEMCLIINELARVLMPGGRFVMVNDNVQYGGEEVPLDLVLSEFAERSGLKVEKISVLPKGKGNSSQQMGKLGRTEIRKCVYIWTKPAL